MDPDCIPARGRTKIRDSEFLRLRKSSGERCSIVFQLQVVVHLVTGLPCLPDVVNSKTKIHHVLKLRKQKYILLLRVPSFKNETKQTINTNQNHNV